jgi:hypothetical protein
MITPLGKGRRNSDWLRAAGLYTLGGGVSSIFAGAILGWAGRLLRTYFSGRLLWVVLALWALALALREIGSLPFGLPQKKCQAPYGWFHRFDYGSVLFMWGFQIGVGLSTFIVFSGLYAVVAAAMVGADPVMGGALMLSYWLGRTLPVWIAPTLTNSWPMRTIRSRGLTNPDQLRKMSFVALLWFAGVSCVIALRS